MNLIRNADKLFEDPRCKQNVIFYHSIWQPAFDEFDKEGFVRSWVNKMPTIEDFKQRTDHYKDKGGSIVILVRILIKHKVKIRHIHFFLLS